jgi:hypothetical protein
MTKPVPTGKRALEVYEAAKAAAAEGEQWAIDALFLWLGDDEKAALERQRMVIDRFKLLEEILSRLSDLKIHEAYTLLNRENEK